MSGGAYGYADTKLRELADDIRVNGGCKDYCGTPAMRRAFSEHLRAVAKAMRAIEWNDSGDGDCRERELIQAVIAKDAELRIAIADAEAANLALQVAIETARSVAK